MNESDRELRDLDAEGRELLRLAHEDRIFTFEETQRLAAFLESARLLRPVRPTTSSAQSPPKPLRPAFPVAPSKVWERDLTRVTLIALAGPADEDR